MRTFDESEDNRTMENTQSGRQEDVSPAVSEASRKASLPVVNVGQPLEPEKISTVEIVQNTNRYADYAKKAAQSVTAVLAVKTAAAAALMRTLHDSTEAGAQGPDVPAQLRTENRVSAANRTAKPSKVNRTAAQPRRPRGVSVVIAERKAAAEALKEAPQGKGEEASRFDEGTSSYVRPDMDEQEQQAQRESYEKPAIPAKPEQSVPSVEPVNPAMARVLDPDGSPYDIAYKAPNAYPVARPGAYSTAYDRGERRGVRVLGFDLGDGESAVAILDGESTVEPRMLPLGGRTSMITAVGMRDGHVVVGEEANVLAGAQDVRVRFKSRYLTDPQAAFTVRQFAQGVLAELMRTEPGLMAQVTRTVVGCPAGWGEGRRMQYAGLLESAGFPNVVVVPEPRAAFLYARHARGLRVDANLMRECAIVIDIGSSTTDFAYIINGHQQEQSLFGDTNLGGGLLDELILDEAIERSPDARELRVVMEKSPAWKSYCELEARRLKERYFEDEVHWRMESIRSQVVVCYDKTLMLEMELNGVIVDKLINKPIPALGGRSFLGCLRDSLRAAQEVSAACPPQVVILTGGASRMAFFRQACMEAFGAALMVLCPEPECSIARGLAYAGRVDESLRVFRQEVASLAHGTRLSAAVNGRIYTLYGPLASTLYDIAQGCALESISLWRKGAIATLEEMETWTAERIVEAFSGEEAREQIEPVLRDWMNGLIGELEGELSDLCVRCGVPPERMSLTNAHVDVGLESVDMSLSDAMGMDALSTILGVVLAVIGASICGGGGLALVSTGPIGLLIGGLAGAMIAMLGKSNMESAVRKAKIPMFVRRMIRDNVVMKGLERKRAQVESAIVQALADPRNGLAARLSNSLGETLGTQMEEMARGAEMSIQM